MSDQEAMTPRVILFRHGETEWAKSGRLTGVTDIDLTAEGVTQVSSAASKLVGAGKLIDPSHLTHVFVSPRLRATRTFDLLLSSSDSLAGRTTYTEHIAEWDYGDYEGLNKQQVKALRLQKGQHVPWTIWSDGCEGGESMKQVTDRLDDLILRIKHMQEPHMHREEPCDVLIVAHGLILRCLVKRWLRFSIDDYLPMIFSPGAVAVLSYKDNDLNQPAFHLGNAF